MIININGWPGTGKLSIARRLCQSIGGRILDNHTIFNVAFSLLDFGTPEFYETVRAVRQIAFNVAIRQPPSLPLILTSAYAATPFGQENWIAIREMASMRRSPLCNVVLDCSLEENIRRLQSPGRASLRKLTDPEPLLQSRQYADLLFTGGDHLLRLDVSQLTAGEAAKQVHDWLGTLELVARP